MAGDNMPRITSWLRVGEDYANLIQQRGPAEPLPALSEELKEILSRLPIELQEQFIEVRTAASARLVAAGEEDKQVLDRIWTKGYAHVRICDEQADAYQPAEPLTKVRKVEVGDEYISLLRNMGAAPRVHDVPEDLVNRLPMPLRKRFLGIKNKLADRLLEDNELLQEYQKNGRAFVEVYNGADEDEDEDEDEEVGVEQEAATGVEEVGVEQEAAAGVEEEDEDDDDEEEVGVEQEAAAGVEEVGVEQAAGVEEEEAAARVVEAPEEEHT